MTGMQGNPHAETAASRLRNGTHTEVARAAVEATLAVAHELRTANLLAFTAIAAGYGHKPAQAVGDDIDARLGLGKGKQ